MQRLPFGKRQRIEPCLVKEAKAGRRNDGRATMFITLLDTLALFINSSVSAQALGDFQIEKSAAADADGGLCPSLCPS